MSTSQENENENVPIVEQLNEVKPDGDSLTDEQLQAVAGGRARDRSTSSKVIDCAGTYSDVDF